MRQVVQIVSSLPPPVEGLGGYALALGDAVAGLHGIQSMYIVGTPSSRAAVALGQVVVVRERSRSDLAEALAAMPEMAAVGLADPVILLHYVNYGYQKRGCPWWLLQGLAQWREQAPNRRLVTLFHEVYAFGPPWRSSFWLSPVQRYLAARLARISDEVVTSLESYARTLRRWRPGLRALVLPVFSTVGEPGNVPSLSRREPFLVTFGGPGPRARAYGLCRPELERSCGALGIETVIDIGPPVEGIPPAVGGRPVQALGVLPSEQISLWLRRARAGFIAYPRRLLGKSTVFAAYAAHGVVPIVACHSAQDDESVKRGQHYVLADDLAGGAAAGAIGVAARARTWYQGHTLSRQAGVFAQLLFQGSTRG